MGQTDTQKVKKKEEKEAGGRWSAVMKTLGMGLGLIRAELRPTGGQHPVLNQWVCSACFPGGDQPKRKTAPNVQREEISIASFSQPKSCCP